MAFDVVDACVVVVMCLLACGVVAVFGVVVVCWCAFDVLHDLVVAVCFLMLT